jgi:hypothetical protein
MKTIEWLKFLREQRQEYGKIFFTVTELANVAGASSQVMNVELARLIERGVMQRFAQGRYGSPEAATPQDFLPALDASAYITGFYALHLHNLVTQVPTEITCFTNHRHNRSRERQTPLGKFVLICVKPGIYAPPSEGCVANPEQALCDFLYLCRRESLRAENLVTFRNLHRLRASLARRILKRYPKTVAEEWRRIAGIAFGRSTQVRTSRK